MNKNMRQTLLLSLILLSYSIFSIHTFAATFIVSEPEDLIDENPGDGNCETATHVCTLRAAIMEANANSDFDLIIIDSIYGTFPLTLETSEGGGALKISTDLTLQGRNFDSTVITQTVNTNVFTIDGGNVHINNLAVSGGNIQFGGGFYIDNAKVKLTNVEITDNKAFSGGAGMAVNTNGVADLYNVSIRNNSAIGAFGGGVANYGEINIYNSTISGNDSNRAGGIYNQGTLRLYNVTVSGNTVNSPFSGTGGIVNEDFALLRNVTITNNTGIGTQNNTWHGGGLYTASFALTSIKNSIVAGNDNSDETSIDCVGQLAGESKYNLIGDSSGCEIWLNLSTYILDTDPELGPIRYSAILSGAHELKPSSPAIGSAYKFPPPAVDACEPYDQWGAKRYQTNSCDMGALAYVSNSLQTYRLILVDAENDVDIAPIYDGYTIDLSKLPAQLSIRAEQVNQPGSVIFEFNGNETYKIENIEPYALSGDSLGDYVPIPIEAGEYFVRATPFTEADGQGDQGIGLGINFTVIGNTPDPTHSVTIRARGNAGGEHIALLIDGVPPNYGWWLGTSFQEYTVTGIEGDGDINVIFDNDGGSRDVIIDWVKVDNQNPRQAENMQYNTGAYANGQCGGGEYTEWLHCNGVIGFGNISDNFQ